MAELDPVRTFDITLGGIPLKAITDPTRTLLQAALPKGSISHSGQYVAQTSDQGYVKRDVPEYIRRFDRGCGLVEMRDQKDAGGYAWAEDADMWSGNGIKPSGRRVNVGFGLGLGYSAASVSVLDTRVFGVDLWAIANNGKILKYVNADPTSTPVEHPTAGTFAAGTGFRAGYSPVCMEVFATTLDGAGAFLAGGTITPALYVYCAGPAGAYRVYEFTTAWGWKESAVLTFAVGYAATCWWEGRDGVGAQRLAVSIDGSTIRHCIYGFNPLLSASYVTPITVGNPASTIVSLVSAPQHLYVVKTDGIHDFNELRAWNLTPYYAETFGGRGPATLYDDHLLAVLNSTVDRYDLGLNGAQQRIPGACGPMQFMQDGTPIRGTPHLGPQHDGWLLGWLYNPQNKTTYVGRGKDRRTLNIDVPNPMVWHFAEQVLRPVSGRSVQISHMRVTPSAGTGLSYLWMFVTVGSESAGYDVDLYYAPLSSGSGSLSFQASGGSFTYNPSASIFHTALTWEDRNATKGVRRYDFVARQTSPTATIELRSKADGSAASAADPTTYVSQGTLNTTSTTKSITPTSGISGSSIALLSILTTPSPYTAPPILHEISPRARVVRESFDSRTYWIVMEKYQDTGLGSPDPRDPDSTFALIAGLQQVADPTTLFDEANVSHQVYVEQGARYDVAEIDGERRLVMGLEVTVMS